MGLIYNGNRLVAEHVIMCGHRTLVLSDRFHPLFKLFSSFNQNGGDAKDRVLMVETRLNALPVAPRSLDVLVLSAGLPPSARALESLVALRTLLRPGGLFVWTHPSQDGVLARFMSGLSVGAKSRNPGMRRADLCRTAMAAGFCEVGQTAVSQPFGDWVVTTGRRGVRPWESGAVPDRALS